MENIDFSLVLSILAILGSIFTYIKHDRKIKAQEKILNDYQIEKINEEKILKQKAFISAYLLPKIQHYRTLRFFNKGQASATNIRLMLDKDYPYLFSSNPFPYKCLNPGENIDLRIPITKETPNDISFKIIWDDPFDMGNFQEQFLHL